MILLANKIDSENRVITEQLGIDLANEMGAIYFEVSAKK